MNEGTIVPDWTLTTLDNGVISKEHWTTVDAADDLSWAVFHYSGAAAVVGCVGVRLVVEVLQLVLRALRLLDHRQQLVARAVDEEEGSHLRVAPPPSVGLRTDGAQVLRPPGPPPAKLVKSWFPTTEADAALVALDSTTRSTGTDSLASLKALRAMRCLRPLRLGHERAPASVHHHNAPQHPAAVADGRAGIRRLRS